MPEVADRVAGLNIPGICTPWKRWREWNLKSMNERLRKTKRRKLQPLTFGPENDLIIYHHMSNRSRGGVFLAASWRVGDIGV
jgi:hypothetical protein